MSTSSVEELSLEEKRNQEKLDKQFSRFELLFGDLQSKFELLAQLYQQQQPKDDSAMEDTNAPTTGATLPALLQQVNYLFLELKSVSRSITNLSEVTKNQMGNRKKRLDAINLQCESILYERSHFVKEIAIARDFHSKHPEPSVIELEEFYKVYPEKRSADVSAHELWLARLQHEYVQREQLLQQQKAIEKTNSELKATNEQTLEKKKEFLATMKRIHAEMSTLDAKFFVDASAAGAATQSQS